MRSSSSATCWFPRRSRISSPGRTPHDQGEDPARSRQRPDDPRGGRDLPEENLLVIPDVYANAGGVTVSYFEWLKNLSHVRLGRLDRRRQAAAELRFLHAIEMATGKRFTEADRSGLVRVTDEMSIVNSGLEETMVVAYQEIRETLRRQPALEDLRTAAFLNAIHKVARVYVELGIFP